MAKHETMWELKLPGETADQLLLALVLRDLVHGSSFDVEVDEEGSQVEVDFTAGDELEDSVYNLLVTAEVDGTDNSELIHAIADQILADLYGEAQTMVEQRVELAKVPAEEVAFQIVDEGDERWDLVTPDWLAPESAEVPFGFRPFRGDEGDPWPDDAVLDAHGRVVLVPDGVSLRLYGVPAPSEDQGEESS